MSSVKVIKQKRTEVLLSPEMNVNCYYNPYFPLNPMGGLPFQAPADIEPYWIYVPPNVTYPFKSSSSAPDQFQNPRIQPQNRTEQRSKNPKKRFVDREPPISEPIKKSKMINSTDSPHKRPSLSYLGLIIMALRSHPEGKANSADVCQFIVLAYPFYATCDGDWEDSIRQTLSRSAFIGRIEKFHQGTKKSYWTIDPAYNEEAAKFLDSELENERKQMKSIKDIE